MPDTPAVPTSVHHESSLHQIYEHVIAKTHSLKQDAFRELEALESAGSRIAFLKTHIGNLDSRLVTLAGEVKNAGLYFLHWGSVPTMPAAAQELLAANVPSQPEVVAAPEPTAVA